MVVPPHRDGGQAQYVERPVADPAADIMSDVIGWMERNLDQPVAVSQLASRAVMSARTFARRFVQEAGTTPQRWLIAQRILLAQELLEQTDETVDVVAERADSVTRPPCGIISGPAGRPRPTPTGAHSGQ